MFKLWYWLKLLLTALPMRLMLAYAPEWFWRLFFAGRRMRVDGRTLTTRAQAYLGFSHWLLPPASHWTPQRMRRLYSLATRFYDASRPVLQREHDLQISLPDRSLGARVYAVEPNGRPGPAILYFHGGGFVIGGIDTHEHLCRKLALACNAKVISIAYRLAPEHPFPAAVEDAQDVWTWCQQNAETVGIDPARIAVAGDSAGGTLSLLIANSREMPAGVRRPAAAALIYPLTDARRNSATHRMLGHKKITLTKELMDWFEAHYVPPGTDLVEERLSPIIELRTKLLPPTIVVSCGFDPLRNDDELLYHEMRSAGCEVVYKEYRDLFHGFITLSAIFPQTDELVAELADFLTERFAAVSESRPDA